MTKNDIGPLVYAKLFNAPSHEVIIDVRAVVAVDRRVGFTTVYTTHGHAFEVFGGTVTEGLLARWRLYADPEA